MGGAGTSIRGKFIMSINDVPGIRKLFKGYRIEEVATSYSAGGADKKVRVAEFLIMNYRSWIAMAPLLFPERRIYLFDAAYLIFLYKCGIVKTT